MPRRRARPVHAGPTVRGRSDAEHDDDARLYFLPYRRGADAIARHLGRRKHLAFLSIFPNTEGFSVVIPKAHYLSHVSDQPDQVICDLLLASGHVARLLDDRLADVGRTGMIFEGFGVDHLHAQLFPMHGTRQAEWAERTSGIDTCFDRHDGYISSHDGARADDAALAALARRLRDEAVR